MTKKFFIRPVTRTRTSSINEKNSSYLCPSNTVLTGRCHKGDENGKTQYEYATLGAFDESGNSASGTIVITNIIWSNWFNEDSGSGFDAIGNRVIVGRKHKGDETGKTYYQTGIVKCNGKKVKISRYPQADLKLYESQGKTVLPKENLIIIGITHTGDENGVSTYYQGYIVVEP